MAKRNATINFYEFGYDDRTYENPKITEYEKYKSDRGFTTDEEVIKHMESYSWINWFIGTQEEYNLLNTVTETYHNVNGESYIDFKGIEYLKNGKVVFDDSTWLTQKRWEETHKPNYFYYKVNEVAELVSWIWFDYLNGNQNGTAPKFEDLVTDDNAIELTKTEYDTLKAQNDKDNKLESNKRNLKADNEFISKLQVAEQSVFGLLNMHMESINTEIAIRESRSALGVIGILENWKRGLSPSADDLGVLAASRKYLTDNGADHTKVVDLKTYGMFLALSQTERITEMYDLVINQGQSLTDAWKNAIAKVEKESPVAKLGQGLHETYSRAVLGDDLYNKLASIFDELDLGTHMEDFTKAVTTKTLALAPKSPTDTSGIV